MKIFDKKFCFRHNFSKIYFKFLKFDIIFSLQTKKGPRRYISRQGPRAHMTKYACKITRENRQPYSRLNTATSGKRTTVTTVPSDNVVETYSPSSPRSAKSGMMNGAGSVYWSISAIMSVLS